MPVQRSPSVDITPDLRISARDIALTPAEALQFAERVVQAAMMRKAALMPARGPRRGVRMKLAGKKPLRLAS